MLRIVADWAALGASDTVLDLYCGTGSFSLYFARAVERVIGVEVVEDAVEDAKKNAARNNIGNCDFIAGIVEEVLDSLTDRYKGVDLVVVDPPRAGIHKKA
jgi:23S rRNA (uracil1939-C5)-methyltransferase